MRRQLLTFDHLAQFDRTRRIAILNTGTPDVRAALWREQLRRFALRADLSEEQHAFIRARLAPMSSPNCTSSATRQRRVSVRGSFRRRRRRSPSHASISVRGSISVPS
jgi:hypothetical protein